VFRHLLESPQSRDRAINGILRQAMFSQSARAKPDHLLLTVDDLGMLALYGAHDHKMNGIGTDVDCGKFHKVFFGD